MSKQIITGMREYKFEDEKTGREVAGLSVYYIDPLKDSQDGLKARGYTVGKLSIKPNTELYARMLSANYDKPFEADVAFDIVPGNKKPVLADIVFKQ